MNRFRAALILLQYLSLDVVLGAVACGSMAGRWLGVHMPLAWWIALPLAVWVMYTTDHLLDARRLGQLARSGRHRFHVRHFIPLARVWGIGMGIGALVLPWFLPVEMLAVALVVGGLSVVHFGLIRWVKGNVRPWLAKEAGVALVYTAGVWGGPWALAEEKWMPEVWLVISQFFCLALFNLLLFARYEMGEDTATNSSSWARGLGETASRRVALLLALLVAGSAIGMIFRAEHGIHLSMQIVFLTMLAVMCWVWVDESRFRPQDRYRWVADGVFMLPLLVFW